MNEEGDAMLKIWRNKFTGENSKQTEASVNERSKFAKQLGGLRGAGGSGVPRHNVRPCKVSAHKLPWAKKLPKSLFIIIC